MLSHQLQDQVLLLQVSHLVIVFDLKMDDPLQGRLPDTQDFTASDVLAQEHAEVRRFHRTEFVLIREIDERKGSGGGHEDPPCPLQRLHRQHDLVHFRLRNLLNPGTLQGCIHLGNNIRNGYSIQGHSCYSFLYGQGFNFDNTVDPEGRAPSLRPPKVYVQEPCPPDR